MKALKDFVEAVERARRRRQRRHDQPGDHHHAFGVDPRQAARDPRCRKRRASTCPVRVRLRNQNSSTTAISATNDGNALTGGGRPALPPGP